VIGGGSVGYMLAQQLEEAEIRVKLIEHDRKRCVFLADTSRSLILHGTAPTWSCSKERPSASAT
jgi:TrkA-N domain.